MAKSKEQKAAEAAAAEAAKNAAAEDAATQPPVDGAEPDGDDVMNQTFISPNPNARPKTEGVLDFVKALNVKEVNTLLALFEPPFAVSEIWAAGRAVIDMGEKLESYISANRLPSFASHQAATTVTGEEIAKQVRAHMAAAATTADGTRPVVGATGEVALDPVLAGLLINLATRALALFLQRLGNK